MGHLVTQTQMTKDGFSMVEVLLASSILLMSVTVIVGAIVSGQGQIANVGTRARALAIAEEGIDAVRNIQAHDFCSIVDGTHGLSTTGDEWVLAGLSDTTDVFVRELIVTTIDSDTREIEVRVSWQQGLQSRMVALTTRVTRWRDPWWNTDWLHRKRIFFDNADLGALSDFPILVALDAGNIDYTKTLDAGEDIRFIDGRNTGCVFDELSYEIERQWNETGQSFVWVRVPGIDAASDTDFIWMYYDNSLAVDAQNTADVWSNGYVGVWHFAEDPGPGGVGEIRDSTGLNHATAESSMTSGDSVVGQIGPAFDFDGSNDHVFVTDAAQVGLDVTGAFTLSAWVSDSGSSNDAIVSKENGDLSYQLLWRSNDRPSLRLSQNGNSVTQINGATTMSSGSWNYLTARYDGTSTGAIFLDGISDGTSSYSNAIFDNSDDFSIGSTDGSGNFFSGDIDEVRMSSVSRSDDWILAQFRSMAGTLTSFGAEE